MVQIKEATLGVLIIGFSIFAITDGSWPQPTGECKQVQDSFLYAYNNFYRCTLANARITSFCMNCVYEYNYMQEIFDLFQSTHQRHMKQNVSCFDVLCRQDDIAIPCRMHRDASSLWEKSRCDNCFNNETSKTYVLKDKVVGFMEKYSNVDFCFSLFREDDDDDFTQEHDACSTCHTEYSDFEKYYFDIWRNAEGDDMKACRDIYDKYNVTMKVWSTEFQCHRKPNSSYSQAFVLIGFYVFFVSFLMYLTISKIIPALGFNINKIKHRTKIGTFPYLLNKVRHLKDEIKELGVEELERLKQCPCLPRLTLYIKETRNLRKQFTSDRNPHINDVCMIHKNHGEAFHNYLSQQFPEVAQDMSFIL